MQYLHTLHGYLYSYVCTRMSESARSHIHTHTHTHTHHEALRHTHNSKNKSLKVLPAIEADRKVSCDWLKPKGKHLLNLSVRCIRGEVWVLGSGKARVWERRVWMGKPLWTKYHLHNKRKVELRVWWKMKGKSRLCGRCGSWEKNIPWQRVGKPEGRQWQSMVEVVEF